jgi:hypothetical protein
MEDAVLRDQRAIEVGRDRLDVGRERRRKLDEWRVDPKTIGEVQESGLSPL